MTTKGKTEEEWQEIQESIMLLMCRVDDVAEYTNIDGKQVVEDKELLFSVKGLVSHLDPDKKLAVRLTNGRLGLTSSD